MLFFDQFFFSAQDQAKVRRIQPHISKADEAVKAIHQCLVHSVARADKGVGAERIGLLLSGGVDSSLLLALLDQRRSSQKVLCLTVHTNPQDDDVTPSKEVSQHFGAPWVGCQITSKFLDQYLDEALALPNFGLYVTAANLALIRCLRECKRRGVSELWIGNGLDMMFGGGMVPTQFAHNRRDGENFHRDFWQYSMGLLVKRFAQLGYPEMNLLAERYKIKIVLPFCNLEVLLCARSLWASLLFRGQYDKYPIRLLARQLGVPARYAFRPKQQLQVSSGLFDLLQDRMFDELPALVPDGMNTPYTSEVLRHDPLVSLRLYLALRQARMTQKSSSKLQD